jgi:hypothetical protein
MSLVEGLPKLAKACLRQAIPNHAVIARTALREKQSHHTKKNPLVSERVFINKEKLISS